jgi:hypothetical protein
VVSGTVFHHYTGDEFLAELFPHAADRAVVASGMEQLRAEQRAFEARPFDRSSFPADRRSSAGIESPSGRASAIETFRGRDD